MSSRHRGFTIWETITVIVIVFILAAILMPVFQRTHCESGMGCTSNLKQIGLGLLQYAEDYDQKLPPVSDASSPTTDDWVKRIEPYIKNKALFRCPNVKAASKAPDATQATNYYLNANLTEIPLTPKVPQQTLLAGEGELASGNYACRSLTSCIGFNGQGRIYGVPLEFQARHWGRANYVFLDGHVNQLLPKRADGKSEIVFKTQ